MPHTPGVPLERDQLPVIRPLRDPSGTIGDDTYLGVLLDLCHLVDEGLVDREVIPGFTEECREGSPPEETAAWQLLEEIGGLGSYTRYVRATGVIHTCPDWCAAEDHPRTAIWDPDDVVCHETAITHLPQGWRVAVAAEESGALGVLLHGRDRSGDDLSPTEARQVAAALMNAADELERITR